MQFVYSFSPAVQIRFNQSLVEVYEGSSDFSFRLLALGTFEMNFSVNIMFEAKSARELLYICKSTVFYMHHNYTESDTVSYMYVICMLVYLL